MIITIEVDTEEDEERIELYLDKWCKENFQNKAEITIK